MEELELALNMRILKMPEMQQKDWPRLMRGLSFWFAHLTALTLKVIVLALITTNP